MMTLAGEVRNRTKISYHKLKQVWLYTDEVTSNNKLFIYFTALSLRVAGSELLWAKGSVRPKQWLTAPFTLTFIHFGQFRLTMSPLASVFMLHPTYCSMLDSTCTFTRSENPLKFISLSQSSVISSKLPLFGPKVWQNWQLWLGLHSILCTVYCRALYSFMLFNSTFTTTLCCYNSGSMFTDDDRSINLPALRSSPLSIFWYCHSAHC